MISLDTVIMRQLVAAASTANASITDAMTTLHSITTHNDWECRERDALNDYTTTNRNRIRALQENSSSFLAAISTAVAEFESTETSISDMFSSVETLLSGMFSVVSTVGNIATQVIVTPDITATPIGPWIPWENPQWKIHEILTGAVKPNLMTRQDGTDLFSTYVANSMSEPVALCNFADIDLG